MKEADYIKAKNLALLECASNALGSVIDPSTAIVKAKSSVAIEVSELYKKIQTED